MGNGREMRVAALSEKGKNPKTEGSKGSIAHLHLVERDNYQVWRSGRFFASCLVLFITRASRRCAVSEVSLLLPVVWVVFLGTTLTEFRTLVSVTTQVKIADIRTRGLRHHPVSCFQFGMEMLETRRRPHFYSLTRDRSLG